METIPTFVITPWIFLNVPHTAALYYESENCNLSSVLCLCWLSIAVACLSSVCPSLIMSSLLSFSLGLEMSSSRERLVSVATARQHHEFGVSSPSQGSRSGEGSEVPLLQLTPSFTAAYPDPSCLPSFLAPSLAADFSSHLCTRACTLVRWEDSLDASSTSWETSTVWRSTLLGFNYPAAGGLPELLVCHTGRSGSLWSLALDFPFFLLNCVIRFIS